MRTQATQPTTKAMQPDSFRLPADLRAYLRAEARKNTRSYSGEVVHRLELSRQADQVNQQKGQQ